MEQKLEIEVLAGYGGAESLKIRVDVQAMRRAWKKGPKKENGDHEWIKLWDKRSGVVEVEIPIKQILAYVAGNAIYNKSKQAVDGFAVGKVVGPVKSEVSPA